MSDEWFTHDWRSRGNGVRCEGLTRRGPATIVTHIEIEPALAHTESEPNWRETVLISTEPVGVCAGPPYAPIPCAVLAEALRARGYTVEPPATRKPEEP